MLNYIAVIHKDQASDYGVSFPDFPGCITAGTTIDQAKDMSIEALTGHIQTMTEFGEKIPMPSSLEDIRTNSTYSDSIGFLIITVSDRNPKSTQINMTVTEDRLCQIDQQVNKHNVVHYF
jgi:predicted RNase H-like HicB family nuclease